MPAFVEDVNASHGQSLEFQPVVYYFSWKSRLRRHFIEKKSLDFGALWIFSGNPRERVERFLSKILEIHGSILSKNLEIQLPQGEGTIINVE